MSSGDRFVMLPFYLLKSPAYRSLSVTARALIPEIAMRFNGENNGRISFSVREAGKAVGRDKDTAGNALHELEDKGFLDAKRKGYFSSIQSKATEWRLTWLPCGDERPTKEFMRWQQPEKKQIAVPLPGTARPKVSDGDALKSGKNTLDRPKISDGEPGNLPSGGPKKRDTYNIPGGRCFVGQPPRNEIRTAAPLPDIPAFLDRRRPAE
jgi:hypothetical protein